MIIKGLIEKNYSDSPYTDNVVYYTKLLAMGAIVKNQEEADAYESRRSMYMGDLYCKCKENKATYDMFRYTENMLRQIGVPDNIRDRCKIDPASIPENLRNDALDVAKKHFIANYVEENEYYRKLLGLPPIGAKPLYIDEDLRIDNIGVDYTHSITEMQQYELNSINDYGIYKSMLERYSDPQYDYLQYIGSDLTIYAVRKAVDLELLYTPPIEFQTISEKFKDRYVVNRVFTINTIKSEAYNFQSEYYNQFLIIFILIQTMIDLISEVQDHIIKHEAFDERCVRYIFEANGVPYYDEIPFKYQCNMLRSLNTLLKYKSTAKCMVEICSLFGFDSFNIFKYYLLKDRNIDPITNEYVFNYDTKFYDNTDNPVSIKSQIIHLTNDNINTNSFSLDYPIKKYEDLGNIYHVIVDGKLVNPNSYTVKDGKLVFNNKSDLIANKDLEIRFIYNEKNVDVSDKSFDQYIIKQKIQQFPVVKDTYVYSLDLPTGDTEFFTDHNQVIVSVGSVFINSSLYTVDSAKKQITFDKENTADILLEGRIITIIYIYNDNKNNMFIYERRTKKLEGEEYSGTIDIPEPFENYVASNRDFFVIRNSTFLDNRRYFIENNKTLSFIESEDQFNKDIDVEFNFLYNKYSLIEFAESSQVIKIDVGIYQYDIEFPFEDYLKNDNIIEVSFDNTVLNPTQYTILKDKLTLVDKSLAYSSGHSLTLRFYYAKDHKNTFINTTIVPISSDGQTEFEIPEPFEEFLNTGNAVRFLVNGKLLDTGTYQINQHKFSYVKPEDAFRLHDTVVCYFYSIENNIYNISIDQVYCKKTLTKNKYSFIYPFFRYLQSGNSFIVLIGSTIITRDRYTIDGNYIILDDDIVVDDERDITLLFIYNNIYEKYNKYIVNTETIVDIEDERYIKVSLPTEDYLITKNNSFIVALEDGTIVPTDEYELIDGYIYFIKPYSEISKHGTKVRLIFNYINNRFKKVYEENIDKDFTLKFVKVPIGEKPDTYLKDTAEHLPYDSFVTPDKLWDTDEDLHEDVKKAILNKEFSYVNTKYISIDTVMSFSKLTFELPYFFQMLFDDVKLEDRLRLQIPEIQSYKMFRLSDVLCYLFSITYNYYDLNDDIMQDPEGIMYIKGFNFRTDYDLLVKKIVKLGFNASKIGVDKFRFYYSNLNSIKEYLSIFENNIEVRRVILRGMFEANNKREYDAFKIAYESLMQIDYNTKFFKIATGEKDTSDASYSNFLKYRDDVLYNSIMYIDSIKDKAEKQKYISERILAICNSIDTYFDSKDYEYLWSKFPGVGLDFIRNYVKKVIDFFKSYKITISSINTLYKFDSKYEQSARAIDGINYWARIKYIDFTQYIDGFGKDWSRFTKKDKALIIDKIYMLSFWFKKIGLIDSIDDIYENWKVIDKFVFKDKIGMNIIDKLVYISKMTLDDMVSASYIDGITKLYSVSNHKETISPLEKIYITRTNK